MPSKLLVHPTPSADGVKHRITPESAGWTYVGFESRAIDKGVRASLKTRRSRNLHCRALGQGAGYGG